VIFELPIEHDDCDSRDSTQLHGHFGAGNSKPAVQGKSLVGSAVFSVPAFTPVIVRWLAQHLDGWQDLLLTDVFRPGGFMCRRNLLIVTFASLVLALGSAPAGPSRATVKVTPDAINWAPAPLSLPAAAQIAVLTRDLSKHEPHTAGLKLPDGYSIPPHTHPLDENITVLQGKLMMGLGTKVDRAGGVCAPSGIVLYAA
jgi:hypothetical protein